ncbi:TRAP transporter permease [Chloroflexota bacterium]
MEEYVGKNKLSLRAGADKVLTVSCALIALLYLHTAYAGTLPTFQQRGILLAFCMVVIFITYPMFKGRRHWWTISINAALSIMAVLAVIQLIKLELAYVGLAYLTPTTYDIILGVGLIIVVLEATRRTIGLALPILAIVSILYAMFGHNLPQPFGHMALDFRSMVYYLSTTLEGIWSSPVGTISRYVFIFMIFAALLAKCGLLDFLIKMSNGLVGQYRGGPAKIAVVSSSMMATLSGSGLANVASTGSFTIPLMKRSGYSATFSGAVEACASTGGGITPPVMASVAFIIADYLGISYWSVCVAAFLPAALYYLGIYVGIDLEAMKLGLKGLSKEEIPNVREAILERGYLMLSLVPLIFLLGVLKWSPQKACFWTIVALLVLALMNKQGRQALSGFGWVEMLASGVKNFVGIMAVCACSGIVVGVLVVTGLAFRLNTILVNLSGGNIMVLLTLCAISCLVLGMGMTTISVYLLVATFIAPALINLGIHPLTAHLFVFFYGNLSHITPPVCTAVFVACGLSGGKPFPTGWQAVKLGIVLFIVPFFFCFNPSLIMKGSPLDIVISVVTATIGVIALSSALSNYSWLGKINAAQRLLFGVGGLALAYPGILPSMIGGVLILPALLYAIARKTKQRESLAGLR